MQTTHKYQRALINPKYRSDTKMRGWTSVLASGSRVSTYKSDAQCRLETTISRRGAVSLNHGRSCVSRAKKKTRKKGKRIKKNAYTPRCSVVTNRKWEPHRSTRRLPSVNCEFLNRIPGFFKNPSSTFRTFGIFPPPPSNAGPRALALHLVLHYNPKFRSWERVELSFNTHLIRTVLYTIIILLYNYIILSRFDYN